MSYYGDNSSFAVAEHPAHPDGSVTFMRHQHHHLELIFVEKGKFIFTTPEGTQCCGEGDVFIANSSEEHEGRNDPVPGESGRYFYLHLSLRLAPRGISERFDRFLANLEEGTILLWNRIPREQSEKSGLFRAGQALVEAYLDSEEVNEFKMVVLGLQIFQILEEYQMYVVPELKDQSLDPFVQEVSSYIDIHYAEDLRLEDMAKLWGYDMHYFCNLFSKHFHETFTHYLRRVRIKKFQSHPKLNQQTIAFCAADVGFQNYSYFYRLFYKHIGCSPREYVKNKRSY